MAEKIVSDTRSAPANVGAELRDARCAIALSVREAAAQTGLRPAILLALEAGDMRALPSGSHARLMARSYARFLGLDAGRVSRQFSMLAESTQEKANRLSAPQGAQPWRRAARSGQRPRARIVAIVAGTALYLGMLSYAWMNFATAESGRDRIARVESLPIPPRPPEVMADPVVTAEAALASQPIAPPQPSHREDWRSRRVELRAVDQVRISIREPNSRRPVIERTLRSGESVAVPSRAWLTLDVSSAQNLVVLVNGEADGAFLSGRRGLVRGVQLTGA